MTLPAINKIGLVGPAGPDAAALDLAIRLLLDQVGVRQVLYLGADASVDALASTWDHARLAQQEFLDRGVELACTGSAEEIAALLAEEQSGGRLRALRKLPEPPARAIEMMDKWIVLAVHDKAVLDEDDIANAHVIVYGHSEEASFKRFGPRGFFTPGPLSAGKLGCLELDGNGRLLARVLDLEGRTVLCEAFSASAAKLVVAS